MNIDQKRKFASLLGILDRAGKPLGSTALGRLLSQQGIELRDRMIRNYLGRMDELGWTENLGRRGRVITEAGRKELEVAVAFDKVGFVNSQIDDLSYRMDFDETKIKGTVIINVSIVKTSHPGNTLERIAQVMKAGLGMGQYLLIRYPGQKIQNVVVPNNHIAIGTICSVSVNGVLLRHGIHMTSRFGGLLEFYEHQPVRFSQIINYDGSTIDPMEIFIKGKMTSVMQTIRAGHGRIGVGFREVPFTALPAVEKIFDQLNQLGLGGVVMIGKPNQPLLDIPVNVGRVGLILNAGLNPVAGLEEIGLITMNRALFHLCEFSLLQHVDTLLPEVG